MPIVCQNNNYAAEKNEKYREHFETFSFPLSDFQKHAIEAIVDGQHSLVCCPTGSGKTLPAEFAIQYFTSMGKRVIYTSPLKALSNEKYYDFTRKYPHISFGVLTGDIKVNPDAQVLIMTAEILLNTLFTKKQADTNTAAAMLSFEMDFENELGCVIMDEIHFINDTSRGNVWEQTLMIIPKHIQLIMLSATLDSPEKFAEWIETQNGEKTVYLSVSNHRIVPLTHYGFITTTQSFFKQIKRDEELTKSIKDTINRPILLQTAKGDFQESNYHKIKKALTLFKQKDVYIKRQHVINEVCKYMFENNLLPAVIFILSRKQIGVVSKEITTNLLEDDSKIPYIIDRECEDVLRRIPNYREYMELPEYVEMVALLRKGIGIHHSGVMPILREIVEILFSKGYIKLLLATETFSVGLNMPIKTTVFTSLSKYDGVENRFFYSHEYMQCSGRAGRRGIDTVGTVIHLNNLFGSAQLDQSDYRKIMNGTPQTLVSKFKMSFGMILHILSCDVADETTDDRLLSFMQKSMINKTIDAEVGAVEKQWAEKKTQLNKMEELFGATAINQIPVDVVEEYIRLETVRPTAINKKRKEIDRKMQQIREEYKTIEYEKEKRQTYHKTRQEIQDLEREKENIQTYLTRNLRTVKGFLEKEGFLENQKLTVHGFIASQIKELNCLAFAEMIIDTKWLNSLSSKEMTELFGCFTNVVVPDDMKRLNYSEHNPNIANLLDIVNKNYEKYQDFENENRIDTGADYTIHYDLLGYLGEWYDASSAKECKLILQRVECEKGVFLGEFVKAVLKINTISNEMEKIAESIGNIELLSKLKEIPKNTLKYVATNQSLYL
jgi:superfamily II RNA helicase